MNLYIQDQLTNGCKNCMSQNVKGCTLLTYCAGKFRWWQIFKWFDIIWRGKDLGSARLGGQLWPGRNTCWWRTSVIRTYSVHVRNCHRVLKYTKVIAVRIKCWHFYCLSKWAQWPRQFLCRCGGTCLQSICWKPVWMVRPCFKKNYKPRHGVAGI